MAHRRFFFLLVSFLCVYFSSFQHYFKSFKQDRNGRGRLCRYSSVLENTSLVSQACSPHDRCTDFINRVLTSLATSSPPISTSHPKQVQDDSLPLIRQILQTSGIPAGTVRIIIASWRRGTRKQYACHLQKWLLFCCQQDEDPISMNPHTFLAFLQSLYDKGLGYSALNSARSAVSSISILASDIHNDTIGNHPLIRKFMRGEFNLRPHITATVICLESRGCPHISKIMVTCCHLVLATTEYETRLLMLMLLATGQRSQSMMHCCIKNMTAKHSRVYFHMRQLLKTSRSGARVDKLIVCAYPVDRRLCPVLYIKEYLKRTKLLRQSDQFFVQCAKPYKGVSRDTIRRWTKQVLKLSGVDTVRFKAHSTRAAATSLADSRHVPMDTILKFAGWKSSSTFARYYKRPIMADSESRFCHAVLTTSTR